MDRYAMENLVHALVGEPRFDDLIPAYLDMAQDAVVSHLYPYDQEATWTDVPVKHHVQTCEIAAYLINRRGAEGETQHVESGVSRTYQTASIPSGFFAGMVPFVGVPICATSTETDNEFSYRDSVD